MATKPPDPRQAVLRPAIASPAEALEAEPPRATIERQPFRVAARRARDARACHRAIEHERVPGEEPSALLPEPPLPRRALAKCQRLVLTERRPLDDAARELWQRDAARHEAAVRASPRREAPRVTNDQRSDPQIGTIVNVDRALIDDIAVPLLEIHTRPAVECRGSLIASNARACTQAHLRRAGASPLPTYAPAS